MTRTLSIVIGYYDRSKGQREKWKIKEDGADWVLPFDVGFYISKRFLNAINRTHRYRVQTQTHADKSIGKAEGRNACDLHSCIQCFEAPTALTIQITFPMTPINGPRPRNIWSFFFQSQPYILYKYYIIRCFTSSFTGFLLSSEPLVVIIST